MNRFASIAIALPERTPKPARLSLVTVEDRGARPARATNANDEGNFRNAALLREASEETKPQSSERILVIEDDHGVQKALKRLFEGEGFTVDIASNGATGLEMFRAATPSIVLLDLRLPGMPGQDVCREVSQAAPSLPIIILSARTDVMDKVLLLELGAHDYVTKPFSPRELLARVRTAMRRSQRGPLAETFSFADVKVDIAKMEVRREGKLVQLTSQEFKVLKFMIQNTERVLTREELLNSVWGYQNYPSTRTVDNHILRLRQKLEKDPANPVHFRTVHSAGYKFVP
jgi:DNA-binding response OmpR family regulator